MTVSYRSALALSSALLALAASLDCRAQIPTIQQPGALSANRVDVTTTGTGLPFAVIADLTSVRALACADAACSTISSSQTVASLTASRVRVTRALDGLPTISVSIQNNGLRLIKCQNSSCSLATTAIIEPGNLGNTDHAIAIPADGRPVLAYYDSIAGDLRYVRCGDAGCLAGNVFSIPDSAGNVGRAPAITLVNGLPQIAYNADSLTLKLALCADLACSSASFKTLAPENPGATAALTARDGAVMVAYMADSAVDNLKLAKCSTALCASVAVTTLDNPASVSVGQGVQIRTGFDGLPILSYLDQSNGVLKFARCTRADCTASTITTVHAPTPALLNNGLANGLVVTSTNTPLLAYAQNGKFTVQHCNTRSCE